MSLLRYTVAVQFDIHAGDATRLETKMSELEQIGTLVSIKAKSAGNAKLTKQEIETSK